LVYQTVTTLKQLKNETLDRPSPVWYNEGVSKKDRRGKGVTTMIMHNGKSRFNGENFAVVATGLNGESKNPKTGKMIQLTILPTDVNPLDSNREYKDNAGEVPHTVCNDCPLINRGCYVNVGFSVWQIFNGLKRGIYGKKDYAKFVGKAVRFGAWGEPTLIPLRVTKAIINRVKTWTGYTHQWAKPFAKPYRQWFMASVSNIEDKKKANKLGWRTFRIIQNANEILPDEVVCPAQTHNVQCINCGLCRGRSSNAKNVAVIAHGGFAKFKAITKFLRNGG
jgi:hypothetical protein